MGNEQIINMIDEGLECRKSGGNRQHQAGKRHERQKGGKGQAGADLAETLFTKTANNSKRKGEYGAARWWHTAVIITAGRNLVLDKDQPGPDDAR